MEPVNVLAKLEVRSFTPEIIATGVLGFGWGFANPQSWGRGGRRGSRMAPFERAL